MKRGMLYAVIFILLMFSACTGAAWNSGENNGGSNEVAGPVSTTGSGETSATTEDSGKSTASTDRTTKTNAGQTTTIKVVENTGNAVDLFGTTTAADGTTTTTQKTTLKPAESTQIAKILLPKTGYDPDGKGVIQIGDVSVSGKTLSLELKNISTKWMTEESSQLEYTCYEKNGKELKKSTWVFGAIDAGASRTGKLTFPAETVEIKITGFKAPYWTQWVK